MGTGIQWYFSLAGGAQLWRDHGLVSGNVRFPDPPAEAAFERARYANSIRAGAQYSWYRNLSDAYDRAETPRSFLDVRHRARGHRKLAMGETAPFGTFGT